MKKLLGLNILISIIIVLVADILGCYEGRG